VRVAVTYCTPEYFTLLGVHTALGRVFHRGEDRVGSADPVVVLSYGFWQRQFAGTQDIVATFACWIPARRAMRFDPMEALRQD
jgi:hypothetical protein